VLLTVKARCKLGSRCVPQPLVIALSGLYNFGVAGAGSPFM